MGFQFPKLLNLTISIFNNVGFKIGILTVNKTHTNLENKNIHQNKY